MASRDPGRVLLHETGEKTEEEGMINCCIDTDIENAPEFLIAHIRTARKEYTCCECKAKIIPGEKYEYVVGKWDGEISVIRTCFICSRIREDYCCSWVFGELRDTLWEYLGFDYITGEVREEEERRTHETEIDRLDHILPEKTGY